MILQLDFSSDVPIYMQIRNQIVVGIAHGQLRPGDRLPTIRALADESGINMMTVNKAYQLLKQEGFILADRRSGAVVNPHMEEGALSTKFLDEFRLLVSQAKLSGVSREILLEACAKLYDEGEEEP